MYGDRPVQLQKRISLLEGYLWNLRNFNKSQDIYNFNTMTQQQNKDFFYKYIYATHRVRSINSEGFFMSTKGHIKVAIFMKNANEYVLRNPSISKLFVPKFYHDRASKNFLKHLQFVGKRPAITNYFSELGTYGRVKYEHARKNFTHHLNYQLNADDNEMPFPDKWHKNKGYSVSGFLYVFKDAPNKINDLLKPTDGLINDFEKDNTEEVDVNLINDVFFDAKTFKKN